MNKQDENNMVQPKRRPQRRQLEPDSFWRSSEIFLEAWKKMMIMMMFHTVISNNINTRIGSPFANLFPLSLSLVSRDFLDA